MCSLPDSWSWGPGHLLWDWGLHLVLKALYPDYNYGTSFPGSPTFRQQTSQPPSYVNKFLIINSTHTHTHTSPICSLSVENSDAYIIWFLTPLKATQEWMCLLLIPSFRSLWEHKGLQMSFSQALPTVIVDFCGKVFINTNSIIE